MQYCIIAEIIRIPLVLLHCNITFGFCQKLSPAKPPHVLCCYSFYIQCFQFRKNGHPAISHMVCVSVCVYKCVLLSCCIQLGFHMTFLGASWKMLYKFNWLKIAYHFFMSHINDEKSTCFNFIYTYVRYQNFLTQTLLVKFRCTNQSCTQVVLLVSVMLLNADLTFGASHIKHTMVNLKF